MPEYFEEEEFEAKVTGRTLRRIVELLRPNWKYVAVFLVMITLAAGIDSLFTFLTKRMIDEGVAGKNIPLLYEILSIYGGLMVGQSVAVFFMIFAVGQLAERVNYDLRKKMFNHLQDLSLSYYSRTAVGWIMARVTSDVERVSGLISWGILDLTFAATSIITSFCFMLYLNWKLALIVMLAIPLLAYVALEFRKRILLQFRQVRKMNSKITGQFNEGITGVRVIKALVREDENAQEFSMLTSDMYKAAYRAAWLSALFLPAVQIVSAIALGAIIWYSGWQVATVAGISIGVINAFISYLASFMWPIQDAARIFAEMQHAIASAERIFSLIDAPPEVANRPLAYDPGSMHGDIEFDHVNFYYDDKNVPVLKDFNLTVKRGETIALVGPTGGGKSTIVNLVCRFYEPKEGEIRIGGHDYTKYSLNAIQSRIGVVLQTPHLFSGNIRENIRYGRLDATEAEIEQAAQLAGAHEFITKLDKQYDEPVGEGGNNLSTGQKQLISLTRAILARPEIFIMDEATSSVDTLTEALIQKGMETLMRGCTSFVIAHRLSTIRRANRILVIENGQIAEMGTHHELLQLGGKYFHLYTRQFRHQMEEVLDPFSQVVTPESAPNAS